MNLIIDCFKLVKGSGKSIGIYNLAMNLVEQLCMVNTEQAPVNIIVFGNSYNRADFEREGLTFVEINKNPLDKIQCILWELLTVCTYAKKYQAGRMVFPRGFRPLFLKTRDTIIIHDMIPFYYHQHYPGYFNRLENGYIMNRLGASIKHADQVVTISEYSRSCILDRYPKSESRIHVIYNGLNRMNPCDKQEESGRVKPYILAITSQLPHKNAQGILKWYHSYYSEDENPMDIVIVGIEQIDQSLNLTREVCEHIECIKYIGSDDQLHQIIQNSKIFLFLSFIEGFGFPPLEAMQLGVPVICSDRSSLPEVYGDAAIGVNPDDFQAITNAVHTLQCEEERASFIKKGYENVKRFEWKDKAKQYLDLLSK